MPAGLQIIGGANLDQDSKVMMMVSKINSSAMSTNTHSSGIYGRRYFTYTFPYSDCICAVSLVTGSSTPVMMISSTSGGTTSVYVECKSSSTAPVFDVYAFKPGGGGASSSGAGIEIYRADGTLGFASTYFPLKPLVQFDYNPVPGATYGQTYSGKRVACVFSKHARELDGTGTLQIRTTPTTTGHFYNNNSTGYCTIDMYIYNNVGKDLDYFGKDGRYMFIDVTNY